MTGTGMGFIVTGNETVVVRHIELIVRITLAVPDPVHETFAKLLPEDVIKPGAPPDKLQVYNAPGYSGYEMVLNK
jgi:hypothetical protein